MSWVSNLGRGAAAAVLWTALAGTALAGSIVVRATGPSARLYTPGKQIADNAAIALKPGDTLVLLDGRGTRTLTGPGNFTANAPSGQRAGVSATAARILSTQTSSERRGGAVRGGTPAGPARSPNLWFVDAAKSGTVCVADPAALKLWRGDSAAAGALEIAGNGVSGSVPVTSGAGIADWPSTLPVVEGAEYTLTGAGLPAPTKIRFTLLAPVATGIEETAAQLIRAGCTTQLDLLIETVGAQPATAGGN